MQESEKTPEICQYCGQSLELEHRENCVKNDYEKFYSLILDKAREQQKIAQEDWDEMPGEGSEWDLELTVQFRNAWDKFFYTFYIVSKSKEEVSKLHDEYIKKARDPRYYSRKDVEEAEEKYNIAQQQLNKKKEEKEEFIKKYIPNIYEEAKKRFERIEKENLWATAEPWEMSIDEQVDHLLQEIEEELRDRVEKEQKEK